MRIRDYAVVYKRAFSGYGRHNAGSLAQSIAYGAVFSIFPLILLAVTVLGLFLHGAAQRQHVVDTLFNVLGQGVNRDDLRGQVDGIKPVAAALLPDCWAWLRQPGSGLGVFDQLRNALNLVWDSNKSRPWVQQKLIDLSMLFTVGLLLVLSLFATGVLATVSAFGGSVFKGEAGVGLHVLLYLGSILLPVLLLFATFTLLYWRVSARPH